MVVFNYFGEWIKGMVENMVMVISGRARQIKPWVYLGVGVK